MSILTLRFSEQYLKQVQEEWLYVRSVAAGEGAISRLDDPRSGTAGYCFCALPGTDRQLRLRKSFPTAAGPCTSI